MILAFFLYLIVEFSTFFLVAKAIGVGWTLLALIACSFVGIVAASLETRRVAARIAAGRTSAGAGLADGGLIAIGSVGMAVPGFVTWVLGALLLLPPVRFFVKTMIRAKTMKFVRNAEMKFYETSTRFMPHTSYGHFGSDPDHETVTIVDGDIVTGNPEEESIRDWSTSLSPEDFTDDSEGGDTKHD